MPVDKRFEISNRDLINDMVKFFNIEEFLRLGSFDIKLMDGDINPEDHQRMKYSIEVRKENVNTKLASFRPQNVDIEKNSAMQLV